MYSFYALPKWNVFILAHKINFYIKYTGKVYFYLNYFSYFSHSYEFKQPNNKHYPGLQEILNLFQ